MKKYMLMATALVAFTQYAQAQTTGTSTVQATGATLKSLAVNVDLGAATVDQVNSPVLNYGVGVEAGIAENIAAGVGLSYWSESSSALSDTYSSLDDLTASAYGKFYFGDPNSLYGIKPFGKGGLAVHRFEIERGDLTEGPFPEVKNGESDISYEFGLDLGAGGIYAVNQNLNVKAEVVYRTLLDSKEDLDQLAMLGGLQYDLR